MAHPRGRPDGAAAGRASTRGAGRVARKRARDGREQRAAHERLLVLDLLMRDARSRGELLLLGVVMRAARDAARGAACPERAEG